MKSAFTLAITMGGWQLLFISIPAASIAGTKVTVGRMVAAGEQISMDRFSHAGWSKLLARYVDDAGMVNYAAWNASPTDVDALDQYLSGLSRAGVAIESSRAAQLAFWINAYNALTIKGILREYPTSSIRNHTARIFGYNIWNDLLLLVGGKPYSLSQIEHEVLRPMGEPRIHFAIVCASRGCPRLLNKAYTAATLEDQLNGNARRFFGDQSNFQYDAQSGIIRISSIMSWFAEDFGRDGSEQMRRISPFLPDEAARNVATSAGVRVSYLDYDWSLNDQAAAQGVRQR